MRVKIVTKITNILHEGKIIVDLYESLDCPTDGDKYKEFIYELTKLFVKGTFKVHQMQGTLEFIFDQRGNNLPKSSSGSIHTALSDFDNFMSGMGGEDELGDEEIEFAHNIYIGLFR
jgi:hypothetical protein